MQLHRFLGILFIAIGFITIPSGITGAVVGTQQTVLTVSFIVLGLILLLEARTLEERLAHPRDFADAILKAKDREHKRMVVIDTSALIAYERQGGIGAVQEFFDQLQKEGADIYVPPGVITELSRKRDQHFNLCNLVKGIIKGKKPLEPSAMSWSTARNLINRADKAKFYRQAEPILKKYQRGDRMLRSDWRTFDEAKKRLCGGIYKRQRNLNSNQVADMIDALRHYKLSDTDIEVMAWTIELARTNKVTLAEMDHDFPGAMRVLGYMTDNGPLYQRVRLMEPYQDTVAKALR